jgi:hypothetical protein
VVLVGRAGDVSFVERSFGPGAELEDEIRYEFDIEREAA